MEYSGKRAYAGTREPERPPDILDSQERQIWYCRHVFHYFRQCCYWSKGQQLWI